MPTTDLPDPDSYKGTAGFKWHPEGSTNRPEQVHALQWPPHLVPGGGFEVRRKKYRPTAESFDGSNIERFTVGGGNERARMPIRFDSWPESLGDLLEDAADGVTVDFYPRLESTNLTFPVELVDVGDVTRVRDDSDRHGFGEFEVESVWKDASTDDQGFWWLKGPNKLRNPRLARGTTDGVAEEWSTLFGGVYSIASDQRAQKLTLTSTAGRISLFQDTPGTVSGDVWGLSVDARKDGLSTNASAQIFLEERTSTGLISRKIVNITSTSFTRTVNTSTAFSSGTKVRSQFRITDNTTGNSSTGALLLRDAKLTLQ